MATLTQLEKALQQRSAPNENQSNLGAGMVSTTKESGGTGTAVLLETGTLLDTINPIVQFDINNSGVGNTDQILRIGSVLGEADSYLFWDQPASAADDAVITDQNGVGCKFVQGFSELVKSKAVAVTEIKVSMASTDLQLNQNFKYRKLDYDGSVNEVKVNVGYTQQKQDFNETIRSIKSLWILDSQYFLEYKVLAGKQLTIFLELAAANQVETFKSLPRFQG
jgi:hypothetical protein